MHRNDVAIELVQQGTSRGVGRQEGLEPELCDGHVDGGSEMGERAEQPQFGLSLPKPKRYREPGVFRGWCLHSGHHLRQFRCQGLKPRIRIAQRLLLQRIDDVPPPFVEIRDPGREPVRVEQEARDVHRRNEQVSGNALVSAANARLLEINSPYRLVATAGYGLWPARTLSTASRTAPRLGSSVPRFLVVRISTTGPKVPAGAGSLAVPSSPALGERPSPIRAG
jgi:hypothetical protein